MKALVGAFNQEKALVALVGAFSVIVQHNDFCTDRRITLIVGYKPGPAVGVRVRFTDNSSDPKTLLLSTHRLLLLLLKNCTF